MWRQLGILPICHQEFKLGPAIFTDERRGGLPVVTLWKLVQLIFIDAIQLTIHREEKELKITPSRRANECGRS